jgi:hypothetical protein
LRGAIMETEAALLVLSEGKKRSSWSGLCVTCALHTPKFVALASVGDSRAVMIARDPSTGKKYSYVITIDHTPHVPHEAMRVRDSLKHCGAVALRPSFQAIVEKAKRAHPHRLDLIDSSCADLLRRIQSHFLSCSREFTGAYGRAEVELIADALLLPVEDIA